MSKGNLLILKNRIKSAKNINSITHSLEILSSSKFKQKRGYKGYEYSKDYIGSFLSNIKLKFNSEKVYLIFGGNESLCAGYNANIVKQIEKGNILAYGEKLKKILKNKGIEFEDLTFEKVVEKIDSHLIVIYTKYEKGLIIKKENFFPESIKYNGLSEIDREKAILFSIKELLNYYMFQASLSEDYARMITMKNATKNSKELADTLLLKYNKERKNSITKEMLEVTGGSYE